MKIPYTDETRDSIITEQKGKGFILLEDQRYITGKFLVFDTSRPPEPVDEVALLKVKVAILESKINELEAKVIK